MDRLRVRLLPGMTPEDWENEVQGIAHAVGARDGRIRVHSPGRIVVELAFGDPLVNVIPALPIAKQVDLLALPMGYKEDGRLWTISVLYTHWLFAGVTGSGKGSLIWSMLRALCPAIRGGTVQVWAIDPKGGMELAAGRPLFARFAADEFEAMTELLDEAVKVMRERAQRLAGVTRKVEPTTEEPLIVVLIDEFAALSAYVPDKKLRDRITQSVSLLLTQGRAVGVSVVGALQDPRKEVIWQRNLFPGRVALRLDEPTQVDMVLGDAARDQGARCDQSPEYLPGVGFVRIDGVREPIRVRAAFVTDDEIDAMVRQFGRGDDRPSLEVVA
jgi:S-DNA-T family DNA segregation ATPase FtsK/SpoIIIE